MACFGVLIFIIIHYCMMMIMCYYYRYHRDAVGVLIFVLRAHLGAIFTPDAKVGALVARIAPVAALFQVADGFVD